MKPQSPYCGAACDAFEQAMGSGHGEFAIGQQNYSASKPSLLMTGQFCMPGRYRTLALAIRFGSLPAVVAGKRAFAIGLDQSKTDIHDNLSEDFLIIWVIPGQ